MRIDGLQDFEQHAKKFLTQAIQKWYPENFADDQSENSGLFIWNRCSFQKRNSLFS